MDGNLHWDFRFVLFYTCAECDLHFKVKKNNFFPLWFFFSVNLRSTSSACTSLLIQTWLISILDGGKISCTPPFVLGIRPDLNNVAKSDPECSSVKEKPTQALSWSAVRKWRSLWNSECLSHSECANWEKQQKELLFTVLHFRRIFKNTSIKKGCGFWKKPTWFPALEHFCARVGQSRDGEKKLLAAIQPGRWISQRRSSIKWQHLDKNTEGQLPWRQQEVALQRQRWRILRLFGSPAASASSLIFLVNDDSSFSRYWSVSSALRGLLWDPSAPGTLQWHQLVIPSFPLARWPAKKLTPLTCAGWSNSVRVCVLGGRRDFFNIFFMSFVLINIWKGWHKERNHHFQFWSI